MNKIRVEIKGLVEGAYYTSKIAKIKVGCYADAHGVEIQLSEDTLLFLLGKTKQDGHTTVTKLNN